MAASETPRREAQALPARTAVSMEIDARTVAVPLAGGGKGTEAASEDWRSALDKVVPAVVVLRAACTRSFDTAAAGSFSATGFVVDKRRGILLTNRHVAGPGPLVAEAMFLNREEVPVHPLYHDPVHDFGFFRYDPAAVQYMQYEEIPLCPEAAAVGLQIRVVGNDSGEKVSILASTLARLDREAPVYAKNSGYNDFNTFYIQAASGTSGGSSGSPVVDCQGRAVALNAGGKYGSSAAYFLPLDSAVRALKFLQQAHDDGKFPTIPRGTLLATFLHKGFEETRRLGLKRETELLVRDIATTSETGMLVVESVVPGGPAYDRLQSGDVLVCVNGEVVTLFLKLEALLDERVGGTVKVLVERGGEPVAVTLPVQDLHAVTPSRFLELSGGVLHALSYQQARNFRFECGRVYVAEPGYCLSRARVPTNAIITKLAGQDVPTLEAFVAALGPLPRGARVPLEFVTYADRHRTKFVLVTIDRHEWYAPPLIYARDDSTGLWHSRLAIPRDEKPQIDGIPSRDRKCGAAVEKSPEEIGENGPDSCRHAMEVDDSGTDPGPSPPVGETAAAKAERVVEPALVMMEVQVPSSAMVDGIHCRSFSGVGIVVHHSETLGLVVVDKNTVVISNSDVMLAFVAYPVEIPAEVVFLHQVHNFALVAYDPSALGSAGAAAVRAAVLRPDPPLRRGDSVNLVVLNQSSQTQSRTSIVNSPAVALSLATTSCPRFRAMNVEVIEIDQDFGLSSGVLADDLGRVRALWGSFSTEIKGVDGEIRLREFMRGIPVHAVTRVVEKIVRGGPGGLPLLINGVMKSMPLTRILEVELYPMQLTKARNFGLSEDWVRRLVAKDPIRKQVLKVKCCFAGSKAHGILDQGDILLTIDGEPVTCFEDVERACERAEKGNGEEEEVEEPGSGALRVTVLRNGTEVELLVGTDVRDGFGTTRMVSWAGCIVQDPHPAVRALGFLPAEGHGVYVAHRCNGSPSQRFGVYKRQWIVEVNGEPTPDLDAFLDATLAVAHCEFVRMKTVDLNGKPKVRTLKQDLHYWPTWELRFDPATLKWCRRRIEVPSHETESS